MTKYIGITGPAGAGKDTLAFMMDSLSGLLPDFWTVQLDSFAKPIHGIAHVLGYADNDRARKEVPVKKYITKHDFIEALYAVLPFSVDTLTCQKLTDRAADVFGFPEVNMSPRQFMQLLGTEVGQYVSKTFWVDLLYSRDHTADYTLITDVRFPHETDKLDALIYVERGVQAVAKHVSESHYKKLHESADLLVSNNGSKMDLLHAANTVLEKLDHVTERSSEESEGAGDVEGPEGHRAACKECDGPQCAGWHIGQHPCVVLREVGRGVRVFGGDQRG